MGAKLNASTSRHPETDGQTERMNRALEEALRNYVSHCQGKWDKESYFAEFAINEAKNSSAGMSPFELNGQDPYDPHDLIFKANLPAVNKAMKNLGAKRKISIENLKRALDRQAEVANKTRIDEEFEINDYISLSKNALETMKSGKLSELCHGPCKIIEKASKAACRLELPKPMKAHPAFHASNLKKFNYNSEDEIPKPTIPELRKKHAKISKIEMIRNANDNYSEYLAKFKDEPDESAEWISEPELKKMPNAQKLMQEFMKKPRIKLRQ